MNFNHPPESNQQENKKSVDINKEKYLDLVNDFAMFITLNASKLEQQILPGKEGELLELRINLRKPIINNLNYADFISQHFNKLTDPIVSKTIISQIYNFLQYIEPRLKIFKQNSDWVKRFSDIKMKYSSAVTG
ncbi:MAG: hypothetical protein NT068_04025 [Candidatus Nomurabacteria bacterium]|nr:hypothetical protein [Candidatus Nomurabacteria bacterium]